MKYVLFTLVKFYLHLLTELVSSKKYWRVASSSVSVLKEEIQVIFFLWNPYKNLNVMRKIEFSKNVKNYIYIKPILTI